MVWIEGGIENNESIRRLLISDLEELVMPEDHLLDPANWDVELPSDPRHQIAKRVDAFISRAMQVQHPFWSSEQMFPANGV